MDNNDVLKEYFKRYLIEIGKESSVKHYLRALQYVSKLLVERQKISSSIYEIKNMDELQIVREYLYNDPEFVAKNTRGHNMYSVGFNHYCEFANGENFQMIKWEFGNMDIEVPVGVQVLSESNSWARSGIIKKQAIEAANYSCEINIEHQTFTSKSTGKQYMEGHHAIPMNKQGLFDKSLDVYANIVCLCPLCHRLLHYGIAAEKNNLLNKIYYDRSERLARSGIRMSKDEFVELVI